jgi:hypothetical protein
VGLRDNPPKIVCHLRHYPTRGIAIFACGI